METGVHGGAEPAVHRFLNFLRGMETPAFGGRDVKSITPS